MLHYKDYVAGWLDSTVHDFLKIFPRNSKSTKYALVTCVDSNLAPASQLRSSPEFCSIAAQIAPLGQGLLLSTELLIATQSELFFGFDEVWFFPGENIEPKPDSAWIVGPTRIDQARLDGIEKWMSTNGCSLGIGDGDGLNFIVKAHGLVKHLLGHSLDQPKPVATEFPAGSQAVAG